MSRAFVKESDDANAVGAPPPHPESTHPHHVTPRGLRLLRERLAAEEARRAALEDDAAGGDMADAVTLAQVEREIVHLQRRLANAVVIDPDTQPNDRVGFGAAVEVVEDDGTERTFRIVGEDEADPEHDVVSEASPVARALLGARAGDVVTWRRPAGDLRLEVVGIRYPSEA